MLPTLLTISLFLFIAWLLYTRLTARSGMSLPFASSGGHRSSKSRGLRIFRLNRYTEITQKGLTLRLETTGLNSAQDALGEVLTQTYPVQGKLVRAFYDVGTFVGVLGMVAAIGIMSWSVVQLYSMPTNRHRPPTAVALPADDEAIPSFAGSAFSQSIYDRPSDATLRPIIPGLTVPFFHVPVLFFALLFSQIVHEIGHAIAAAADAIPILAAGVSVVLAIPTAYVAFPSTFDTQSSTSSNRAKLRIASAGAWHNLLLWLVIACVTYSRILDGDMFWTLGGYGAYEDVSSKGLVVVSIMNDSPLNGHIPLGSIITKVDDVWLGKTDGGTRSWQSYLGSYKAPQDLQGWCVSRDWYKVQPSSCCRRLSANVTTDPGLCFVPPQTGTDTSQDAHLEQGRCVDPVSIFMTPSEAAEIGETLISTSRCENVCMTTGTKHEILHDEICIRPRKDVELLRINLRSPKWTASAADRIKTVIWNGPKEEVLEQLTVGILRPKRWWIPIYLPIWVRLFFEYLSTITLSLFVFNLLPIARLDGAQIVGLLLDTVGLVDRKVGEWYYDVESLEKGEVSGPTAKVGMGTWRRRIETVVGMTTAALLILVSPSPVVQPASSSRPSSSSTSIVIRKDRLYVGNLHPSVDEYTLLQLFGKYGKISKLDFLFHKTGPMKGKPRGYAFLEYSAREDASKALVGLHDKLVRGRNLVVTFAQQSATSSDGFSSSDSRDRPGGRKGTDTSRPTTLSLIKTHGRPSSTSDKIAALEAKLRQMQASKDEKPAPGSTISPEAATAMGILPPRPPRPTSLPSPLSYGLPTNATVLNRRSTPGPRPIIVQLFQWNWQSVARECREFLGPKGYGFVQVSPAQEHVKGPEWFTDYQPVSYNIISKRGTRKEFIQMVEECRKAGVGVIADTIWNHMAAATSSYPPPQVGVGGSTFSHYEYPGIYTSDNFHHDYRNKWEIQFGELDTLADLATEQPYVRQKLADYGNDLLSLGVAGLRLDAVKHIPADDLRAIVSNLKGNPYLTLELIYHDGPVEPQEYRGIGDIQEFRYQAALRDGFQSGVITPLVDVKDRGWIASDEATVFATNHDTERPEKGVPYPLNYNSRNDALLLATIWVLAYPYGSPTVYSGYEFDKRDQGAPNKGFGDCRPHSGWNCEHRSPGIVGMVGFYNVAHQEGMDNIFTEGGSRVAFSRGKKGFLAMNAHKNPWTITLSTGLPDGEYCNVIRGKAWPSGGCSGNKFKVSGGFVTVNVPKYSAVALHVGEMAKASAFDSSLVTLRFCQHYNTRYGENVYVSGSLPQLGSDKRGKAIQLSPDNKMVWQREVDVPDGAWFTYRYIVLSGAGDLIYTSSPRSARALDGWQDPNCAATSP
ncbi:hypothetical protein FRB99_005691 [Tulasnella sp. 403]|nr:hypothetical protein FRB99_005691 [Tulasnella sp. 403]